MKNELQKKLKQMKQLPPLEVPKRSLLLKKLARCIKQQQSKIIQAISEDFEHRSANETLLAEIMVSLEEIHHNIKHIDQWVKPQTRHSNWKFYPSKCAISPQPLGVVGIMAPWNYPFNLVMAPLAAAISAGNRVMIKPSEVTPKTSLLIHKIIADVFHDDEVYVVLGDVSVASAFSQLPLDHILFTGSTQVGKIIMRNAAEHLTPVTLELGGKSPVLIDDKYDLKAAAKSIVGGKWFNAGQTCIAPDYILIHKDRKKALINALTQQIKAAYPNITASKDYSHIVNSSHHNRLNKLLDGIAEDQIFAPLGTDAPGRMMKPVVVDEPAADSPLMQEEIFGPILPIIAIDTIEDALQYVSRRARPLTLYLFSNHPRTIKKVREESISGSLAINDTLVQFAQEGLAFGGVGASGMGAYHGHQGFQAMSHMKSVYYQSRLNFNFMARAPFTKLKQKFINML
ncbi:aldehyde dehydrogenase family protein [Marinicella rhabdoformis]|uniref:aldehyde dehydrogenase family protein n=1 Tax=Marinicella rhabdoformis TaxID=2580566 RepID=UPI0015D0BE9F|nr:aldehyde dehydrogenase family protein [Marinicella rhabdoformis]